ncbi:MAG: hypothetical protein KKB13_25150 [Chloroflexi bacterium]|nr:hypothetical protein [Chloroflexota bacterium]
MPSSEQLLPYLSSSVLDRQYEFSGQTPRRAYVYMLLGLLLSPISFVVAWILFFLVVMVAVLVGTVAVVVLAIIPLGITQLLAILIAVIGALLYFLAVVLSPVIVGGLVGVVEASIGVILGKCRNPTVVVIMGFVAGLVGLLPFVLLAVIVVLYGSGPAGLHPGPVLFAIVFGLLFAVGGAIGGYLAISNQVFCEDCVEWYGGWSPEVGFDINLLVPLAKALNEGIGQQENSQVIIEGSEELNQIVGEKYPRVILRMRKCSNCPEADVQWKATVNWEKDKSKEWFTIMLPAGFSSRLEKELFGQVVASDKAIIGTLYCQNCGNTGASQMPWGYFCSNGCQDGYGRKLYSGGGPKYCQKCGHRLSLPAQNCGRCGVAQDNYRP